MAKAKALTSKLEWHNGTIFTEVLQVRELGGPGITVSKVNSSDLASVVETEEPILAKHGPITFKGLWDPDDIVHKALRDDAAALTKRQVKITNSDATPSTVTFGTAVNFIEDWKVERNKDGLLEFSGSINCNVAPTIA